MAFMTPNRIMTTTASPKRWPGAAGRRAKQDCKLMEPWPLTLSKSQRLHPLAPAAGNHALSPVPSSSPELIRFALQ